MEDPWTRRGFIEAGAAALAAGPALALAQGRTPPPARKLGYAIVGLGGYARQIMPQFKDCRYARLSALVSGTPGKLERYGDEYDVPRRNRYNYANFDRIRDNPDIDIVYVILPNSMHREYSVRASRAGKHVLCEKPMAVSAAECREMIAAAKAANRKLMIGYRSRFQAHNRHAIDLVRKQVVGPACTVTAEHGFNAQPNQWRLDRALAGGGSLMDIGIYSLNAARYLTGEEPVAVTAMESTDRSDPRFRTVEDRIDSVFRFPSGVIASCVSSYSSGHNAFRVTGTEGWIGAEPATPYEGHVLRVKRKGQDAETVEPPALPFNQFVGQLDHLAECVLTGAEPIVPGEEGLRDLLLIEAIYRSAREGRTVEMPRV